jgi:hypothetical protein
VQQAASQQRRRECVWYQKMLSKPLVWQKPESTWQETTKWAKAHHSKYSSQQSAQIKMCVVSENAQQAPCLAKARKQVAGNHQMGQGSSQQMQHAATQ